MKIIFWCVLVVLAFLNGVLSFLFGGRVSVSEMLPFLDSLLIVASIIFGIVGAWLAIIWQNSTLSRQEQHENISYLKKTVFCSFVVISFSLLIRFIYPIIKNSALLSNDIVKTWLKRVFVFGFGTSGLILIIALFFTLLSFDFFSYDSEVKKQQEEREQEYREGQMSQVNNIRKIK